MLWHLFGYCVLSIMLVATGVIAFFAVGLAINAQNRLRRIALAMREDDPAAADRLNVETPDDIVDAAVNAIRFHKSTVGRVASMERQAGRRAVTAIDLISPEELGRGLFDEFCLRTRPTSSSTDDGMTWSLLIDMRPVAAAAWVWVAKYVLAVVRKVVDNHCASLSVVLPSEADADGKCLKCGESGMHIIGCPTREDPAGAEVAK